MASGKEAHTRRDPSTAYRVRRVSLRSLSKFGCALGGLASCLPSAFLAWSGLLLVGGLRRLLESWQRVGIRILGQEVRIDLVSLLNLEHVLQTVQEIDNVSWALLVVLVLVASLCGAAVFLVAANLLGWVYNLIAGVSGGVEVELREISRR